MTETIATPKKNGVKSFLLKALLVALLIGSFSVYWYYFNVYSDGDRTGMLTKLSRRGNLFKTYEGEMMIGNIIQSSAGLANEKFYFSIDDKSLADTLTKLQGQRVMLQYKQYRKSLFWRGDSEYIITGFTKVNN